MLKEIFNIQTGVFEILFFIFSRYSRARKKIDRERERKGGEIWWIEDWGEGRRRGCSRRYRGDIYPWGRGSLKYAPIPHVIDNTQSYREWKLQQDLSSRSSRSYRGSRSRLTVLSYSSHRFVRFSLYVHLNVTRSLTFRSYYFLFFFLLYNYSLNTS